MTALTARLVVPGRGLNVGLDVPAGARLGLVGVNGAGKSSVLAALAGLVPVAEGRIELGGRVVLDTAGRVDVPPHHRGVGLLLQDPALFPWLSAVDNVAFAVRSARARGEGRPGRRPRGSVRAAAHMWLERLDAAGLASRRPHELSGGQRARVAVARVLAADPAVVLLDEPFAAVDVEAAPALREAVRDALAGRTAVLVSHDASDVTALCDRVALLEGGRLTGEGPAARLRDGSDEDLLARLRRGD